MDEGSSRDARDGWQKSNGQNCNVSYSRTVIPSEHFNLDQGGISGIQDPLVWGGILVMSRSRVLSGAASLAVEPNPSEGSDRAKWDTFTPSIPKGRGSGNMVVVTQGVGPNNMSLVSITVIEGLVLRRKHRPRIFDCLDNSDLTTTRKIMPNSTITSRPATRHDLPTTFNDTMWSTDVVRHHLQCQPNLLDPSLAPIVAICRHSRIQGFDANWKSAKGWNCHDFAGFPIQKITILPTATSPEQQRQEIEMFIFPLATRVGGVKDELVTVSAPLMTEDNWQEGDPAGSTIQ